MKLKIFDVTGDSYTNEIENYDGTVLIDFFADWCTPCKMLSPMIEDIADETDVKICKINVENEKDLAQKFGIMSIPTLVVIKNGTVINRSVGVTGKKAILDMIK